MSETFLFNIADKLLDKLGSLALEKLCSAWGGESERENLVETVSTIQAVLLDAEEKQEKDRTRQLTNWLGKLKDAFYDAEDVLGDLEYEASQSQMETRVGFKRKSWSQSADSEDESLEQGIAYLEEENSALHDEVVSARSFGDEAGSSGTAGVP
ncbi:hypothetical protein L1049_009049 [Liquidambar formosana]|uniref:Disease resistance N-terminal domain-containing protein n=1 Tax=Liquidambar formosana TaxID=63359 RepID=A0AAP0S3Y3_LIQFO